MENARKGDRAVGAMHDFKRKEDFRGADGGSESPDFGRADAALRSHRWSAPVPVTGARERAGRGWR